MPSWPYQLNRGGRAAGSTFIRYFELARSAGCPRSRMWNVQSPLSIVTRTSRPRRLSVPPLW
ncbi:MAG: hypothetical protein U0797_12740 [Gemmataceae bacterium]